MLVGRPLFLISGGRVDCLLVWGCAGLVFWGWGGLVVLVGAADIGMSHEW